MLHLSIVANSQRMIRDEMAVPSHPLPQTPLGPLTPRSIVLSVLLGSHPPQMAVGNILEFTSLFGLVDGAVRTALSRMVSAGDLVNDEGTYRLTGRLLERQAQQDAGRTEPPSNWDGTWWTVAVRSDRRTVPERRAFRTWAVGARLGELRPDLWLRPANIDLPPDVADVLVTRGPLVVGDEHQLVAQLWDLDSLDIAADHHTRELERAGELLAGDDDGALPDAFAVLASAQRFLRIEPQLPIELAPPAVGAGVRALYAEVVDHFQSRLAAFFALRRAGEVSTDAR